jgi:3',5'-cyclic AMP phosphodiesterase CpdA
MSFSFAFITDTHLYPNAPKNFGNGTQMQEDCVQIHQELIRQLNDFKPEFVIHGGDIVCGGDSFGMTSEQYLASLDEAKDLNSNIEAPIYYIPGNHDLDPITGSKDAYQERFGYDQFAYTSFVHEDLRFILLDAQEVDGDQAHGHIGSEQLQWLEDELNDALDEGQQVLIFAHQLVSPSEEFEELSARVDNSEEVMRIIDGFNNILAMFHGHLHLNRIVERNNVFHTITAGIICYPMMWRKITVDNGLIRIRSAQLNLPRLLAKSAVSRDDRGTKLLGSETDRDFIIQRTRRELT